MTIAEILKKIIAESNGNMHDIEHLLKVWGYAKTIGGLENLDSETQFILEAAAVVHDIACPLCREKYGSAPGRLQEVESPALVRAFFAESDLTEAQIERIAYLVGRHHTLTDVDGLDCRILLEADYIVNASESGYEKDAIARFVEKHVETASGKALFRSIFGV